MIKKLLVINGCVRKSESRTLQLGNLFLEELTARLAEQKWEVQTTFLDLDQLDLQFLNEERLNQRNALLQEQNYTHPMFDYAQQFARADLVVFLAPIWDWSFPAMVKVYVENISVEGITFAANEEGLHGKALANHLVYVTTLGGNLPDTSPLIGQAYMEELSKMYGIKHCHSLVISGTDLLGFDFDVALEHCKPQRESVVQKILCES